MRQLLPQRTSAFRGVCGALICAGMGTSIESSGSRTGCESCPVSFAVDVCGYAILDNHLHVVLRLNEGVSAEWSDEEVVRRWGELFPPRGKDREPLPVTKAWVKSKLADSKWVATARERLNSLGWFMKCVKEPLARMANREDECRGTFWEGRFKSIAILDEEALLTTLAYVDLNPLAAGIAKTPEESDHTSVKARIDHCREQGNLAAVVADAGDGRNMQDAAVEDETFWLPPIEDRREHGGVAVGLCATMNLSGYLQLLDWSSRLLRRGKARVPREVADVLSRLDTNADAWGTRLLKLAGVDRTIGTVFGTDRNDINRFASARGVTKLSNLNGCRA